MRTDSEELRIARFLSQPELQAQAGNHAVPVLDVFQDKLIPGQSLVVMPLLRKFDDPPFKFVSEVMDFVDQMLEVRMPFELVHNCSCTHRTQGLVFMHDLGIAHR